ncbi:cell envelope integrity EipB family protein [Enterovirga sp.]|jgi:hypothetical protein|uniref:cell envelope integrity EipB family protein n=1 Tax=Enterovirga sp. TaxID=2026350 RepID=UPI00261B3098|nr:cell envelope integrity EipB family protein [Enterovirga sp.]MDB5590270.1 hypothetical protein [Enterovirga sp.]
MRPRALIWQAFAAALLAAPAAGAAPTAAAASIRLAPHRVVYDLSLLSSQGMRGVESARGRIAFDLTGNACQGYSLTFRQVTVVEGAEPGSKLSDLRTASHESGDGRLFRFRSDTTSGSAKTSVQGDAERRPEGLHIRLRSPKRQTVALPGEVVFPNAQIRELIQAGQDGRRLHSMKVFDGADDGRKVYNTLAVIGAPIAPGPARNLEPAALASGLAKLTRWPVTLSYFEQGRGDVLPAYVLSFELYENGVSRALKLDYGSFVLRGEMVRLDLLSDASGCPR